MEMAIYSLCSNTSPCTPRTNKLTWLKKAFLKASTLMVSSEQTNSMTFVAISTIFAVGGGAVGVKTERAMNIVTFTSDITYLHLNNTALIKARITLAKNVLEKNGSVGLWEGHDGSVSKDCQEDG